MSDKNSEEYKPKGYVPPGAEINFENNPLFPPETEYNDRVVIFKKEAVKKLVEGEYGKEEN